MLFGSEDIKKDSDIGGGSSKCSDADSDSDDAGVVATLRAGGSICSGLFDDCEIEGSAAEISSTSGKIVGTLSGRVNGSQAPGTSADGSRPLSKREKKVKTNVEQFELRSQTPRMDQGVVREVRRLPFSALKTSVRSRWNWNTVNEVYYQPYQSSLFS